jgi:hypothetical protein
VRGEELTGRNLRAKGKKRRRKKFERDILTETGGKFRRG